MKLKKFSYNEVYNNFILITHNHYNLQQLTTSSVIFILFETRINNTL